MTIAFDYKVTLDDVTLIDAISALIGLLLSATQGYNHDRV